MKLDELINDLSRLAQERCENGEVAVTFDPTRVKDGDVWTVEAGNKSDEMHISESGGFYIGHGATWDGAVTACLNKLQDDDGFKRVALELSVDELNELVANGLAKVDDDGQFELTDKGTDKVLGK